MRLMCSQNRAEVEAVKNELFQAGILSETRRNSIADALGVSGVELWVQDERDFFDASRLYAEMKARKNGDSILADDEVAPPAEDLERSAAPDESGAVSMEPPRQNANGAKPGRASEPRREELKQARSLLEKGLEEMFQREGRLADECASLRGKVEELEQALDQSRAAHTREAESRAVAERNQAEQISGLLNALERERREWQQQLKSRDDSLKEMQGRLDSMSVLLQAEQGAAAALRDDILSVTLQRDEFEDLLAQARAEVLTEREERTAAEQRADSAAAAQEFLQKRLADQENLQQQIQSHVAGLSSLFGTASSN